MRYTPFHRLIQRLAASAPVSLLLAHGLHRLDGSLLRLTRGRWSWTGLLAGAPVVIVTTTGRRSGQQRSSPLLAIEERAEPGSFALIASNWGQPRYPAWYFNLRANPRAICAMGDEVASYVAHEAEGEEYERWWGYATDTYHGYLQYKQRARRRIPIMVMRKQ